MHNTQKLRKSIIFDGIEMVIKQSHGQLHSHYVTPEEEAPAMS